MGDVVAAITNRDKAVRMFMAELLWIFNVVDLLGIVAAELAKPARSCEGTIPLFLPLR
jgi:hypothetical protein